MTREEAIKVVRNIYQTDAEKEALEVSSEYESCIKNREHLKSLYNDLKKL